MNKFSSYCLSLILTALGNSSKFLWEQEICKQMLLTVNGKYLNNLQWDQPACFKIPEKHALHIDRSKQHSNY